MTQENDHSAIVFLETNSELDSGTTVSMPNSRLKLLVIEDNQTARLYIQVLLRKTYDVIIATNGQEGYDIAVSEIPDIILCDVNMPIKDGFECCKEIKADFRISHIPVIMLTALDDPESIIQGTEAGADDYLTKPVNPHILITKIKNLINNRQQLYKTYMRHFMYSSTNEGSSCQEDELLRKTIEIIKKNISDSNFNVNKLADLMNISPTTLYRRIKQKINLTSIELIREIRMKNAAELLSQQHLSIQEISEMNGYSDVPTFRKHFSDFFGMTPSTYRHSLPNSSVEKLLS